MIHYWCIESMTNVKLLIGWYLCCLPLEWEFFKSQTMMWRFHPFSAKFTPLYTHVIFNYKTNLKGSGHHSKCIETQTRKLISNLLVKNVPTLPVSSNSDGIAVVLYSLRINLHFYNKNFSAQNLYQKCCSFACSTSFSCVNWHKFNNE